jgi:uncharacterized protein YecE (DUF72 family)
MVLVACSGFPVPVSRYWGLFPAVELADTELGIPGDGTVRRWLREAPRGYGFSVRAPKPIAESGFDRSEENKALVEAVGRLAVRLKARGVTFTAPQGFDPTRTRKTAVKRFVEWLPDDFPPVVLDLPGWKVSQVATISAQRPVTAAYDPLSGEETPPGPLAYVRLPGPAGYRSRYDEGAIDTLAEHVRGVNADEVFVVFRNIDMQANAQQLLERLKKG